MSIRHAAGSPLRVEPVTSSVQARPGSTVPCTVRVHNDGAQPLRFSVRVVGIGQDPASQPVPWEPLAPGGVLDIEVSVVVPEAMAAGEHSVAIEVAVEPMGSDGAPRSTPGRRPIKPTVAMAPMVIKVGSLEQVFLRTLPSVVRGRFGADFELEVINQRHDEATVDIAADAPGLLVDFEPSTVVVPAGGTAHVAAKVRGSRHWVGDDRQHVVNIEGSGSAVPAYTRIVFHERPVLARGLRGFVAALVVLALWAGVLGGAALWTSQRSNGAKPAATAVDANNDGKPDEPGTGPNGAPDGSDGGSSDASGGPDAAPPGTDPEAASGPTSTTLRGTVKAGDTGEDGGVLVTLTSLAPLDPADPASGPATKKETTTAGALDVPAIFGLTQPLLPSAFGLASQLGLVDDDVAAGGKFWPARYGTYTGSQLVDGRATLSVMAGTLPAGTWAIDDVPLRRSYEVSFFKEGYDRQSFQVATSADGKPIELDVELVPATGELGGFVRDEARCRVTPDCGLGGVELSVTDGTLTYTTTTSTEPGRLGAWEILGLSTPATYTVTATLAGYGTLSAQEALVVEGKKRELDYRMTKGVGAIGGIVTTGGGVLGGITLTISGGGLEPRTASSLTDGDVGSYLFPGLAIDAPYTITASAPGYITETRFSSTGNATGIDFEMRRITGTIKGRTFSVAANRADLPIPGIGVQILVNGVEVRTLSATEPDLGAFTLTDVPPGTYTVSFNRFDHAPYSEVVTVEAGGVADMESVLLQSRPRQQLDPKGSVSVTVKGPGAGTTIILRDVSGEFPDRSHKLVEEETGHTFSKVPTGTYRVLVSNPSYRPYTHSPRTSVDGSDVEVEATPTKYGQAVGEVVDGLAPTIQDPTAPDPRTVPQISTLPLGGYEVLIYKVSGDPASYEYECMGALRTPEVAPTAGPDDRPIWEVLLPPGGAMTLFSGFYTVRFNAVLDDTNPACVGRGKLPTGYAAATAGDLIPPFEITNSNDPVVVPDIEVFPYPSIRGVVFAPVWSDDGELEAPQAAPTLVGTARLACIGRSPLDVDLLPKNGVMTFEFSREMLADLFAGPSGPYVVPATGELGTCAVEVRSTGKATFSRSLATPLKISMLPSVDGVSNYDDRVLAVVLTDQPNALIGTTSWVDRGPGGELHMIGGVQITADDVIVDYDTTESVDSDGDDFDDPVSPPVPDDGNRVTISTESSSAKSDLFDFTGLWGFGQLGDQQLLGEATYDVTKDSYRDASFDLRVDGASREITAQSGFDDQDKQVVDDTCSNDLIMVPCLDLQLKAYAQRVFGTVDVVTNGDLDVRDEAIILATPPGWEGDEPLKLDVVNGEYDVENTDAGTWQLEFSAEPTSNLHPAPTQLGLELFADVGKETDFGVAAYWDLAQVTVVFQDSFGDPLTGPTLDVEQDPVEDSFPAWTDRTGLPITEILDDGEVIESSVIVRRLPVSSIAPLTEAVTYRLTVGNADDYDLAAGTFELYDEDGQLVDVLDDSLSALTVSVVAGSRLRVVIELQAKGSIAGTVTGLVPPPGVDETLSFDDELTVTVQQIVDGLPADFFPLDATPPAGQTFGVTVPPGRYEVVYSHPDFDTVTQAYTVGDGEPVDGSVSMNLARGSFELDVVTDDVSKAPVDGASVRLFALGTKIGDLATAPVLYEGVTDDQGRIVFSPAYSATFAPGTGMGIVPNSYLLVVRKLDPGPYGVDADGVAEPVRDDHFPVFATIEVPRGRDDAARTMKRRAVMPRTDGSIVGQVTARNIDPLSSLKLPAGIVVTRNVQNPQAGTVDSVDGVDNDATEGDLMPAPKVTTPVSVTGGFSFQSLPAGEYTLTFPPIDGFVTPTPVELDVDGETAVNAGIIEYVATDVIWQVTFLDGNDDPVSGLAVTADGPSGDQLTFDEIGTSGVYEYTAVPPQDGAYVLNFDSIYYRPSSPAEMSVKVSPSSATLTSSIELTALAIIEGTAVKLGAAGASDPLAEPGAITLRTAGGALLQTASEVDGSYRFEVAAGGDYLVRGTLAGYTIENVEVNDVVLGATYSPSTQLQVQLFASATITVTGTPDNGRAVVTVTPATGVPVTRVGLVYTAAGLDPDQLYTFEVTAPNRATLTVPAAGLDPDIGGSHPLAAPLEALRTFTGVVSDSAGDPVSGARVVLYDDGVQVATDPTDGNGEFLFENIGYGDNYSITAKKGGVGSGNAASPIVVEPGSALAVTDLDIELVPRSVTVTFAVTFSAGTATPTITFGSGTPTPGVLTFTVAEDASMAYSISADGYITKDGILSVAANAAEPLTLSPQVNLVRNVVSGEVTGLKKSDGDVTVRFCLGTSTTCVDPLPDVVKSSEPDFSFVGVAPGTYIVWITKGTGATAVTVSAAVEVDDDGASVTGVKLKYP